MIYPSYNEWKNDGYYISETGFRCYSIWEEVYRDIFCFKGLVNYLKSTHYTNFNVRPAIHENYLQFDLEVRGNIFQSTCYHSPKFESSEAGYLAAIQWFEKWKEIKIKEIRLFDL